MTTFFLSFSPLYPLRRERRFILTCAPGRLRWIYLVLPNSFPYFRLMSRITICLYREKSLFSSRDSLNLHPFSPLFSWTSRHFFFLPRARDAVCPRKKKSGLNPPGAVQNRGSPKKRPTKDNSPPRRRRIMHSLPLLRGYGETPIS